MSNPSIIVNRVAIQIPNGYIGYDHPWNCLIIGYEQYLTARRLRLAEKTRRRGIDTARNGFRNRISNRK
jgi:hypothetical protein